MRSAALALALTCMAAGAVAPAMASSTLHATVSAQVLPYARLRELAAPGLLEVTADDLARGYVDAPGDWAFRWRSNDAASGGLLFELVNAELPIQRVRVNGLGAPFWFDTLRSLSAWAAPGLALQERPLNLSLRFYLGAQAQAGVYGWPLRARAQLQ